MSTIFLFGACVALDTTVETARHLCSKANEALHYVLLRRNNKARRAHHYNWN